MAEIQTFEIGDIVQLKSGGPKMTISGHPTQYGYPCIWFAGSKREAASFKAEVLAKVTEKKEK